MIALGSPLRPNGSHHGRAANEAGTSLPRRTLAATRRGDDDTTRTRTVGAHHQTEYMHPVLGTLSLMVGVDTQVFHGFVRCGAVGAITGVGNALPKPVLRLIEPSEVEGSGS